MDVLETDSLPEIRPYIPGTSLSPASTVTLPYPIVLSAAAKLDFYAAHEAFNLVGMFKNPMMMMMLVGGGLVFAMPYIMVRSTLSFSESHLMFRYRKTLTPKYFKTSKGGRPR